MKKLAIIGSGLSGLTLANHLKNKFDVTVFEKSRGVGGRLATRRAEAYAFDHGAQYFTARTEAFRCFIQPLIDEGVVQRWVARHVEINGVRIVKRSSWETEEPRYVGTPGMNSIAKRLAHDLDIRTNTKITSLVRPKEWQLEAENGPIQDHYEWVITTVPGPQALALLPEKFTHQNNIRSIEMRGCFSLMLGFSEQLPLEFEAAHITNSDISWIAVNSHKPQRGALCTLVVHSSAEYADKNTHTDRDVVISHLCQQATRIIGHDANEAQHKVLHGWRYANNRNRGTHQPFIDTELRLAACGDWCLGGRVEGAFTSAQRLSEALMKS